MKPTPAQTGAAGRLALTTRRLTRLTWLIFALAVAVFLIRGADRAVRPRVVPNTGPVPSRVAGFGQVGFRVGAGSTGPGRQQPGTRRCGLLAVTLDQQNRGLMNRHDLAGYDGMVFQFQQPTSTEFYMKDTLIPLSIAFFDASGHFVSATDMPPCVTVDCPLYHAAGPYTVGLEVALGHLPQLGVGTGSTITVGGAC